MRDDITDEEVYGLIKRLERFAELTDSRFKIPGTNIPIGLDAIIGFIPVLGEVIGLLMSSYLLYEARKIGVPTSIKLKMIVNIILDFAIGFVPVLGDIGDIGFRSNLRNMRLILEHVQKERSIQNLPSQTSRPFHYLLLGIVLIILVVLSALLLA